MQPSIVIVSNRLPVSVKKVDGELEFYPSVGGLATGLASYVNDKRNKWIGWPGVPSEELTEADKKAISAELLLHNCYPVFLTKKQLDGFYNGYSNSVLWPFFHDLPTDHAKHEATWKTYRSVNAAFAEAVVALSDVGSTIWVHDYQLLLLPAMLREQRPHDKIGFFLHIPFPAADNFAKLPHAKALVSGILGAGLVGFHTESYTRNFLETCQQLKIGIVEPKQVLLGERIVRVTDFPISIDYSKFTQATKNKAVKKELREWKRKYRGKKVILTVDRLDPTKGLVERLEAYQEFLRLNPKQHRKVVMVMLAVPSRTEIDEYKKLKKQVEKLVAQINQTFGTPRWQPIDYLYTSYPFEKLAALYQRADIAFITPLRDGMNLVAKEYIASKPKQDGVLILSETAGAAEELKEAIIVNPRERAALVEALTSAVTMPRRELKRRLRIMQKQIASFTIHEWASTFMGSLKQTPSVPGLRRSTMALNAARQSKLVQDFKRARNPLLFIDYDGVLVPITSNPSKAVPSERVMRILEKFATTDRFKGVLISGRPKEDLERWFGHLTLAMAAEHGAVIRRAAGKTWRKTSSIKGKWQAIVLPILQKYTAKTPGAFIEEKGSTLAWHYRAADTYYAQKNVIILKRLFRSVLRGTGLVLRTGNKVLEIRPHDVSKGRALHQWLRTKHDFILVIGDDDTDEDMFAAAPESAYTIKVGRGRTLAHYRLRSTEDVLRLLEKLLKG